MAPVHNPMRRGDMASPSASERNVSQLTDNGAGVFEFLLTPFISDYRFECWYTRHTELALTLLLAALQVSWLERCCCRYSVPCTPRIDRLCRLQAFEPTPATVAALSEQGCSHLRCDASSRSTHALGAPLRCRPRVEDRRASRAARACRSLRGCRGVGSCPRLCACSGDSRPRNRSPRDHTVLQFSSLGPSLR